MAAIHTVEETVSAVCREDSEAILAAPPPLIEMLPVGIYACEAGGKVRWFNRRAAEFWGRSPAIDSDGERFCGSYELYTLDGSPISRIETPMAYVLRTGRPVSGKKAVVKRPDGSRIMAMVHIAPLRNRNGDVIGAINCFHDVTDDVVAERAARESEQQMSRILEAISAAIYTTDAQGRITFYNRAAVDLAGREPTLGTDEWCVTWKLYEPDGTPLPHGECPMAQCLRHGRPIHGVEAIAERPDGSRVPFLPYPNPIHDAGGALIGAVNLLVDISERKAAETRQKLLFAELNHRIKNNMQMLHALLSAAAREAHSDEAQRELKRASERVGSIASAQATLYRTDNATSFDAAAFIEGVCGTLAESCGHDAEVSWTCSVGDLPNDIAVPLALIVSELVTNAARHGRDPEGRVRVRVSLDRDGDVLALVVEDSGTGFEPCAAIRRSSGLGLVKGLAAQIGGTLEIERGAGARCVVRFSDRGRPDQD